MNAQHTSGPWRVSGEDHNGQAIVSSEYTEVCTCWHHSVESLEKQMRVNAVLIAAAPDHALIGWAMCVQDGTWEEWGIDGRGEFVFCGLRYTTSLDEFGCPTLTPALRAAIVKAKGVA